MGYLIPKPPIRKIREDNILIIATAVIYALIALVFLFILGTALMGCATTAPNAKIVIKENEVEFYTDRPTSMSYKDATYDSKQPSLLRTVIEGSMVREVNKDN